MKDFAVFQILIISLHTISAGYAGVATDGEGDLVSVAVLYRHGDRAPIGSFPNDPYHDIKYWPMGFGELLNKGKLKQYDLGQWLRNRYDGFLSTNYSPKETLVESSNVDRCLMSAASNLAGLYSPTGNHIWKEDLPWEPIPIHSTPQEIDTVLAMSEVCPKFTELLNALRAELNPEIYNRYKSLYDYISENTGGQWQNFSDMSVIQSLYSVLYVYEQHNSSYIPSWAHSMDMVDFTYVAGLSFASETFTPDLKRFKAGPFFNYLIANFQKAVNAKGYHRLLMLSAHDGTVASVLNTMGTYDFVPPEFAATVIWELRKDANGGHFINMFYKKPSVDDLLDISMAECDFDCGYDEFKRILSNYTIDNETWERECNS